MAERMGTYCTVISGYAFKSGDLAEGVDIPVIKIGNISNGNKVIVDGDTQYVDSRFLSLDKKYHINEGDILISLTGSHMNQPNSMVGRCCRNRENQLFLLNQRAGKIIPNENADKDFLYYIFRLGSVQFAIANRAYGGANQVNVSPKDIMGLKMNIPALPVQKKIGKILSTYDSLIENNNKRIRVLEQMAENLYKEWFVRFRFPGYENAEFENGIPKRWEEMRLCDFGISLDSGSRPSGGINSELTEGMPSLGAEAVNGLAEFDFGSVKYIPCDFYKKMKRGKNTGRDILVYKDGAYIGRTTIFRNGFPFEHYAVNEHVFLLNATRPVYQNYLYFTLHQPAYFTLMQNLNRNAAQPGLSKPDMQRIKITVPSELVVVKFNEFVEPILAAVFDLAKQNQNLSKQRDLLLPRLMSGKLGVEQAAAQQPKTTIITFESFVSKLGMAARGTAMSEADLWAMYQAYLDDDATE